MKKYIITLLLAIYGHCVLSQMAISETATIANQGAMLDLISNNKGLAIPRMTEANRLAISATQGLLVFETNTKSFWYHNGSNWVQQKPEKWALIPSTSHTLNFNTGFVGIGTLTFSPMAPLHIYKADHAYIIWQNDISGIGPGNGFYFGNEFFGNVDYIWNYENAKLKIGTNNNTGLTVENGNNPRINFGENSTLPSAIMSATSTNKGFLPPRMTDAQIQAIPSPPSGLIVYNLTYHRVYFRTGSIWQILKIDGD